AALVLSVFNELKNSSVEIGSGLVVGSGSSSLINSTKCFGITIGVMALHPNVIRVEAFFIESTISSIILLVSVSMSSIEFRSTSGSKFGAHIDKFGYGWLVITNGTVKDSVRFKEF
ncbi:hypothetical protein BpHYR1_019959, partial [Brachionus plicatilis]